MTSQDPPQISLCNAGKPYLCRAQSIVKGTVVLVFMEEKRPQMLVFTETRSARLDYIFRWVFEEQLGMNYLITGNMEDWQQYKGIKLNYSHVLLQDELNVRPHPLLTEPGIRSQIPGINRWKHSTILFYNQPGAAIPFDIFSAIFYLISRYEEYLPHRQDSHGRYDHRQSLAAEFSFLQEPVVDEWLAQFRKILERKYRMSLPQPSFRFQPSYDVDIAWKYLHKGSRRNMGGYVKDLLQGKWRSVADRIAVLNGKKNDPFDTFAWLDQLHRQHGLQPCYFMLLGQWGAFDKNADRHSPAMKQLMQQLSEKYLVGIHPSYGSHQQESLLHAEIALLAANTGKPVQHSRQHYIKFSLPDTYRKLAAAGISDEYSMGYASANGFRAGTSRSFPWFDLLHNEATPLRIHPFIYMDATSRFYDKLRVKEAFSEWQRLFFAVKKVNGTFISIAHNHLLADDRSNSAWRKLYEQMLREAATGNN